MCQVLRGRTSFAKHPRNSYLQLHLSGGELSSAGAVALARFLYPISIRNAKDAIVATTAGTLALLGCETARNAGEKAIKATENADSIVRIDHTIGTP